MAPSSAPLTADPTQRADQSDVPDGVGELCPPPGLEVGQQVQLAGVVGAVALPACRHDAERVAAASQRPRDQVRRVDPEGRCADDAGPTGNGGALPVGRRQ